MLGKVILVAMALLFGGCGSETIVETLAMYDSSFDPKDVDLTERYVKATAKRWKLRVFEKSRREMSWASNGRDAFFVALYHKEEAVLVITNVGVPEQITISIVDYGVFPKKDLYAVAEELAEGLNQSIDTQFRQIDPITRVVLPFYWRPVEAVDSLPRKTL